MSAADVQPQDAAAEAAGTGVVPYAVYERATGRVVAWGRGSREHAELQAGDGQAVLLGAECAGGAAWVDQAGLAPVLVDLGPPPSCWHRMDWQTRQWVDARGYAERRAADYPPLTEFADAWVHLQAGNAAPMQAYVQACQAVKQAYPKPSGEPE